MRLNFLRGAKNEFLWLVLFLPGSNFGKIYNKTKSDLFEGVGLEVHPPLPQLHSSQLLHGSCLPEQETYFLPAAHKCLLPVAQAYLFPSLPAVRAMSLLTQLQLTCQEITAVDPT